MRKPDFNNMLKVLNNEKPDRPTLFDLFLNETLYRKYADRDALQTEGELSHLRKVISAFKNLGYDYATVSASDFHFAAGHRESKKSLSLNEGGVITDRESFVNFPWTDPADYDYSRLEKLKDYLPVGIKLIVLSPSGVLENTIGLVGYEKLCYLIADDTELVKDIFDAVGSRLLKYYKQCFKYDTVGAFIVNDDWGFKTQTMLSTADMRKYVIPWHKKIVEAIHNGGRKAILHSCGNLDEVMEDIIEEIGFDAKHSFEDEIIPVEAAYEKWGDRIAIMGGIDMDFICRATPQAVKQRSQAMLEMSAGKGGYALGTGNSVPEYVPEENFLAMVESVF